MKRQQHIRFGIVLSYVLFFSLTSTAFGFDHPQYDIKANINADQKTITASEKVSWTNPSTQEVKELYFHVYANRHYTSEERDLLQRYTGFFKVNAFPEGFQAAEAHIQSVMSQGERLSFEWEGKDRTLLKIPLPQPLPPGQTIEVDLTFDVTIPHAYGRLGWH